MATHKHTKKAGSAKGSVKETPTDKTETATDNKQSVAETKGVNAKTETQQTLASQTKSVVMTMTVPNNTPKTKEPTQSVKANASKLAKQETKTTMADYTVSMFEYSVDLADVEAPEPLPSSEYPVTIEAASLIQSKQGAGPLFLVLGCRVSPDNYPADFIDGDPDGTYMTWYAIRVEDNAQGRWRMKQFKLRCGLEPRPQIDPNEFLGLTINVLTGIDEYEGEKRPVIKRLVGEG